MTLAEPPHTMQIAQILISLLHAWGLDPDLDRVCESKLGLLRPMVRLQPLDYSHSEGR